MSIQLFQNVNRVKNKIIRHMTTDISSKIIKFFKLTYANIFPSNAHLLFFVGSSLVKLFFQK